MALKKCKECGQQVSTKAKTCPNCGVKNPTQNTFVSFIVGIGSLIFIVWILVTLVNGASNKKVLSGADRFAKLSLNVRTGPATSFKIIAKLKPGEQVHTINDSVGWAHIRSLTTGKVGWVSSKYLSNISKYNSFQKERTREKQQTAWKKKVDKIGAYIMLQDFVKDRLVSPSSAKFYGVWDGFNYDKDVDYLGNHTYLIRSYVDSKNAFGAPLRTYFIGKIKQTSKDNWQLLELHFQK